MFNQVNWSAINTNAQFNPAGEQVNANFGKATAARERADHAGGDPVYVLIDLGAGVGLVPSAPPRTPEPQTPNPEPRTPNPESRIPI